MIWGGRRDHLVGRMNPLVCIPSSFEGYPRGLLVWLYIKNPSKILIMRIRGEKKQKNTIDHMISKKYLKLWRLIQL